MEQVAVEYGKEALQKHDSYDLIADYIKKGFDEKFGSHWCCIVGDGEELKSL